MTTNTHPHPASAALQQLGFTEYEAQAYVTLLESGELSGYELARRSRIPRANIYAVLDKLHARGAVWQAHAEKVRHYAAVPPDILLRGIGARQKRLLEATDRALADLATAEQPPSVFNLRGRQLLARSGELIDAAETRLLIAIQPREAATLAPALRAAHARGVEIETLCLEACEQPCQGCQGTLHRRALAPADGSRWLLLVADRRRTLVGRLGDGIGEGLVTAQPLVVELVGAYIHQSLALALLGDELAGRFEGLLSEQALQTLYPDGPAAVDN